jgi:PBP1b-binding outer membrane lipoprotein LpoB
MLRKRGIIIVLLGMAVVLFTGCSQVTSSRKSGYDFSAIEKTAVVSVTGDLAGARTKNQVTTLVELELLGKGYSVIERERIDTILEEQKFQRSDITTTNGAARAGHVLNIPAAVMTDIQVKRDRVDMTMKMVDVETGEIVWIGQTTGHSGRTLATFGGAVVGAAAGVAAGGDESGRIVGGVVGGALGGAAGHTLTASETDLVRKMIEKIGTVMPSHVGTTTKP